MYNVFMQLSNSYMFVVSVIISECVSLAAEVSV